MGKKRHRYKEATDEIPSLISLSTLGHWTIESPLSNNVESNGEEAMLEIRGPMKHWERDWLSGGSGNSFRHLKIFDNVTSRILETCLKDLACLNFR